jgi:hypothetical protein
MNDTPGAVFSCGPSSEKCTCNCPGGPCEHQWDGPWQDLIDLDGEGNEYVSGSSATCSKCGMLCLEHDLWVSP